MRVVSAFERGPLEAFEVVWNGGHVEVIRAHQVSYQGGDRFMSSSPEPEVIQFHGEFDGRWILVLRVLGADLRSVRNLTRTEQQS